MIAKIFLQLCQYPTFRRLAWKPIYNTLAKSYDNHDWHFMNYGYEPLDGRPSLTLLEVDERHRYSCQLYHYLASEVNVKDKHVLEVGSGRGGGASHIKRYLQPMTMTGMDIAGNAVAFANKTHRVEGLKYVEGNAENMPFDNDCFDVVINVESCHAYGSVPNFLKEVRRVLKPNGYFLCTDIRLAPEMENLRNQLKNSGLKLLREKDITSNVVKAIELENPQKIARIQEGVSSWVAPAIAEFAGVSGSQIDLTLQSGKREYAWFVLQKK